MLEAFARRRWGADASRGVLGAVSVCVDGGEHHYQRLDRDVAGHELEPLGATGQLVIGLHGLGANENQMRTLVPLAVDGTYIALRGRQPRGRDGFGWFPSVVPTEVSEVERAVVPVLAFVRWAQDRVGVGAGRTVVVGYSQAAAVAAAIGTLAPDTVGSVALASAALPAVVNDLGDSAPDRAFVAVGLRDPLVDEAVLARLRLRWVTAGTSFVTRDYDIPHVVSPEEVDDIGGWIAEAV